MKEHNEATPIKSKKTTSIVESNISAPSKEKGILGRKLNTLFTCSKQFIRICVTLLFFLIAYWLWNAFKPHELDASCAYRKEIIVKIGDTVLAIPRRYRPIISAPEGKQIPYADWTRMYVCQREGEPPIEVKRVSINREGDFFGLSLHTNLTVLTSPSDEKLKDFRPTTQKAIKESRKHFKGSMWREVALKYYVKNIPDDISREKYYEKIIKKLEFWETHAKEIIKKQGD